MSEEIKFSKTVTDLLNELENNKNDLKKLSENLDDVAKSTLDIIPKTYDMKSRFVIVDRTKIITELYDTLLRYKTEISNETVKQIEILKKTNVDDDNMINKVSHIDNTQLKNLFGGLLGESLFDNLGDDLNDNTDNSDEKTEEVKNG